MVRGYRLLYREGVARKRLPPKRLFTDAPGDTAMEVASEPASDPHELPADAAIDSDQEDANVVDNVRAAELPSVREASGLAKRSLCGLCASTIRTLAGRDSGLGQAAFAGAV